VAARLQAWRLCFFHNSGRVWVVLMVEGKGDGLSPGFVGKWGGERERGKDLKSSSPLSLHLQGRRSCTVPFKTASCSFFFFFEEKEKKNLGVTQKWIMTREMKKEF
jgi:hypothetical protein